jgi:diadenosine tetraphosphate (Ap4A) HIT family hydrolase
MQHFDSGCVFCRELHGQRDTNFAARYPEVTSRIVAQTPSLVAFPCIGQLAPGHFLVVPKRHYCTFAEASRTNPKLIAEFTNILTDVHRLLDCKPNSSLVFEHGTSGPSDGGCGIYHAHVHIVPCSGHIDLNSVIEFSNIGIFDSITDTWPNIDDGQAYIAYGSQLHGFNATHLDQPLPSQYLRKVVANVLGYSNWDWRTHGREADLLKMLAGVAA